MKYLPLAFCITVTCLCSACAERETVFQLLDPARTGVDFSNDITTTDSLNALYFEYLYNGGGVAVADLNNDGLADLFFTGNQVSSRLYLNQGELRFRDVTDAAGVKTSRWCTGVAVADINGDGWKDIYVSVAGYRVAPEEMENLLFINLGPDEQGVPQFVESAGSYGLNDSGYSTQAAFLDYDLDGDPDLYLLTNALEKFNRNNLRPKRVHGEAESTDRLYRNNGNGTFTNVSQEAGILIEGYGLGVTVADLNFDGFPDVYAANDFQSNDLIWINNGNGTFSNQAARYLKHQTHNGMGVDIADLNNDALPDIAVLDMLPEDNYRQKMMIPKVNYDKFGMKQELGYEDQYMRNTVQLNQGLATDGAPRFSEIGNLLGMAATDWSWAVLFADLDNDGWKDCYITNGYRKDVTNMDFISYSSYNQIFGTVDAKKKKAVTALDEIAEVEISNYLFHNKGGLMFENATTAWGLDQASFSNGAAYADLDLDGDLDLVVNNIDAGAFLLENKTKNRHYLQLILEEDSPAITALNTKVLLYSGAKRQYQELSPYRGYKSTVEDVLHFGLGAETRIDSLLIYWPDGTKTMLRDVKPDQRLRVRYEKAVRVPGSYHPEKERLFVFQGAGEQLGIDFYHADNQHTDLKTTRTQVIDHSKAGPAPATGDINGDGLEDFFIGGNAGQPGSFYIQTAAAGFTTQKLLYDSLSQDVDALFFDADSDGDQDLYVVSGGTFAGAGSPRYQDRLYVNDGAGHFQPAPEALPTLTGSRSCVRAADYDQDGDPDLFVGGRVLPGQYPVFPRSFLLENRGGKFVDVTPESLRDPGLVTDALWTDFNTDGRPDLIVVGEWMPISFWENQGGKLEKVDVLLNGAAKQTEGWWMHLNSADLDGDGDQDYLAGNFGLNSKLKADVKHPVKLYAKDFDQNGAIDPLLSCFIQGKEYLMHERDLLIDQIPGMKRRFTDYHTYAEATVEQTLFPQDLDGSTILSANMFTSILLENLGNGQFAIHPLPLESQLAPITASLFADFNGDGAIDILTAGNFLAMETNQIGRQDASYGGLLLQTGPLRFQSRSALAAGLLADGDIRALKKLSLGDGRTLLLFGVYGDQLKAYILASGQRTISANL